ncbi:MAG: methyl-accepting chemotaxis protein [Neomegalonema sp.]|nr:methyl-accepting chemotaxis protein [Neomegalonema sp.]
MDSKASAESELGLLINQTGKLRMLSHRAVMFALLAAGDYGTTAAAMTQFQNAIAEFAQITARLNAEKTAAAKRGGNDALAQCDALAAEHMQRLDQFLTRAEAIKAELHATPQGAPDGMPAFAAFVAGELLASLNAIIQGESNALDTVIATRKDKQAGALGVINETAEQIEKISLSVRLIALNAAVEASRAGEKGRGFGVIATEIKELSESATRSAKNVRDQISTLS